MKKAFSEGKPNRDWILKQLGGLVNFSRIKIGDSNTGKHDRIKWSRVLVSVAMACSHALRDKELDELKEEVRQLKLLKETELYERVIET